MRELTQPVGQASDRLPQELHVGRTDVDEPIDPAIAQLLRRHRPNAPQRVDGQLLQKRLDPPRSNDRETVGFLPPGCNFGEELVRRDAC